MAKPKISPTQMKKLLNDLMTDVESLGLNDDYFFISTLKRYNTQIEMLDKLQTALESDGMIVTKEYVKGRENYYVNPAVREYNNTVDSANKTVATLLKIYEDRKQSVGEKSAAVDPLLLALNKGKS